MSQKFNSVFETTFADSFSNQARYKEYSEYLSKYIETADGDPYWENVHRKIIRGDELTDTEISQLHDLINNVNINEMMVNKLLGEDMAVESDTYEKVSFIDKNKGKLERKWDIQFASTILEQYQKRGYISPKQQKQVDRLFKALGGHDR